MSAILVQMVAWIELLATIAYVALIVALLVVLSRPHSWTF